MKPSRLIIIIAILFFASPIIFAWWFRAKPMGMVISDDKYPQGLQYVEPELDTFNWISYHSRIVKGQ